MKINPSGYSKYINRSYEKFNVSSKDGLNESDKEKKNKPLTTDSIEISSSFREISGYIEQMKNKGVDMDRINAIKSSIQKGQYQVSSEELAAKIIEKLKEDL